MGLINPKPRFGLDTDTGLIYDYRVQKDVPITDAYSAPDGVWNLILVKQLILSGDPVESARVSGPTAASPALPPPHGVHPVHVEGAGGGISAPELKALELSPLQLSALGITAAELEAGVPAAQVKAWGLTDAKATALNLTPAQRAVLLP